MVGFGMVFTCLWPLRPARGYLFRLLSSRRERYSANPRAKDPLEDTLCQDMPNKFPQRRRGGRRSAQKVPPASGEEASDSAGVVMVPRYRATCECYGVVKQEIDAFL